MSIFKKSASENLMPWWCHPKCTPHKKNRASHVHLGDFAVVNLWEVHPPNDAKDVPCFACFSSKVTHFTRSLYRLKICELFTIEITTLHILRILRSAFFLHLTRPTRRIQGAQAELCWLTHRPRRLAVEVLDGLEQTNVVLTWSGNVRRKWQRIRK